METVAADRRGSEAHAHRTRADGAKLPTGDAKSSSSASATRCAIGRSGHGQATSTTTISRAEIAVVTKVALLTLLASFD